jgi:hypothetical protein
MRRTPAHKGGNRIWMQPLASFRLERASSLRSPACGRDKRTGAKPGRVDPSQISCRHFDRFTGWRKLALPSSRSGALCPHGRDRWDNPRDEELAATSFAPLRLARFSDGSPRQSKQPRPPVGCLKSAEALPLRSEKDDSGKMKKHTW